MSALIKPPTPEEYRAAKINNALSYSPVQYPCQKCGWPVIGGYVCGTCGDADPSEPIARANGDAQTPDLSPTKGQGL